MLNKKVKELENLVLGLQRVIAEYVDENSTLKLENEELKRQLHQLTEARLARGRTKPELN